MNHKILIIYPYFSPAEKAGGIVSSLCNLVNNLDNYQFYIYTSCYDLDGTQLDVKVNQWINANDNIQVYYSSADDANAIKAVLDEIKPDKIYINGIYGNKFFFKPIMALKGIKSKVIIAPRGMLHAGALKVKALKKKVYLSAIKISGLLKGLHWHATDEQEVKDIQMHFKGADVTLAQDTPPLQPNFANLTHTKQQGQLKLVFLSLITEKKNLLFLLEVMDKHPQLNVSLDVIGPIKDHAYWEKCLPLIEKNKDRIKYVGQVAPKEVVETLLPYDFFILPTLGENFGHVIFEALTAGKPVIISHFTPWSNLEAKQAGFNLDLDEAEWHNQLTKLVDLDNEGYQQMAQGAQSYLKDYLKSYTPKVDYEPLFG
ncbi:glycosyltransferase [Carboxylicivirga marina]|uniref:Glycosyltransferase n=1 Tax=Carboxylicivirga marina TaxID=2800988 RepID=A0ABS1HJ23_9BACT|nr:glycosyltransferase [Carboxylicivirga marina]MBK3517667.1 glycosyltransferase [Carboxylicivirga marina]